MPYEVNLNLPEILRTTLFLIDNTVYPGKESKTVEDLRHCLVGAITALSLEKAKYEQEDQGR